jgi:hypothetical protein
MDAFLPHIRALAVSKVYIHQFQDDPDDSQVPLAIGCRRIPGKIARWQMFNM